MKEILSVLAGEEVMARDGGGAAETSGNCGGSGHPPGRVRNRTRVGGEHLPGEGRRLPLARMRERSRPSWEESPSGGHSSDGAQGGDWEDADSLPLAVEALCQPCEAAEGERSASRFEIEVAVSSDQQGEADASLRSQEVDFASGVGGGVGDGNESDLGAQSKNRLVGRAAAQSKQVSIVGSLQRPRGCLLPSASEPPTYATGLGPTGDAGSFRELGSAEPSGGGWQSRRGGPLRDRPLAGTVEGDPAGPAGGLRCGTVVGLPGEGDGVGYVGSGERGEPHDGQSPKGSSPLDGGWL